MGIEVTDILTTIGGLLTGGGLMQLLNWRSRVRVAKAEADTTVAQGYAARINELHQTVKYLNETTSEQALRIKDLNHGMDDKTDQIRKLTERAWEAEQALNHLNAELLQTTKERDEYRRLMEHYRDWRCERHDCRDERGRKPPRVHKGAYVPPERGRQPEVGEIGVRQIDRNETDKTDEHEEDCNPD